MKLVALLMVLAVRFLERAVLQKQAGCGALGNVQFVCGLVDAKTYDSCPAPIDPEEKDKFRAHGLFLRPGRNAVHTLYVVHHGNRESIEVFAAN